MSPRFAQGLLCAMAAGSLWGLVFIAPLFLPDYPAPLLAFGRYVAFGLIALLLAIPDYAAMRQLQRADWWYAFRLALVGNITFYLLLTSAVQLAGAPLPTLIASGALPVVIAVVSNLRNKRQHLPWLQLLPSLVLIVAGIALVNQHEIEALQHSAQRSMNGYIQGVGLAIGAMICWTWYPIRNADWLRAHPACPPRVWATAQGLVSLPIAVIGYLGICWWMQGHMPHIPMPLGPRPATFLAVLGVVGLLGSWLGTLCWNAACQRLPTSLVGQLIVFETVAALGYAYALRHSWPPLATFAGIGLLLIGVLWAVRANSHAVAPHVTKG